MKTTYTKLIILFLFVTFYTNSSTQTVSTFITNSGLNGPDGFALDSAQNLYVANWGGGSGNNVLKITPLGTVTAFVTGLNAPDGLAFDNQYNLFVSNYASGVINRITPSGVSTVFATGLSSPSALVFDTQGNLYVSNYTGNTVSKITPAGVISTYATGFNAPLGLALDNEGNLYVSNYNTGIINKVNSTGVVSIFASIPNSPMSRIQYLLFGRTGNLYVPSYGHNKIYKVTPGGIVSVFAGTGVAGGNNGSLDSAQFNGPNSIALNTFGEIYISEYNSNRIRKITGVEPPVGVLNEDINIKDFVLKQNYPNPFNSSSVIRFALNTSGYIKLGIYDINGKELMIPINGKKGAGDYELLVDMNNYPSGTYFYKLTSGRNTEVRKMIYIK